MISSSHDEFHETQEADPHYHATAVTQDALKQFFDGAGDLFCILDGADVILAVNPAWEQATGRRESVLLRTTIFQSVMDTDKSALTAYLRSVRTANLHEPVQVHFLKHDGRPLAVGFLARSATASDGRQVLLCSARIGEGRRITAGGLDEDARYRRLVERSPEATVVVLRGKVVLANAAAQKLFRVDKADDLRSMAIDQLIHEESRATFGQAVKFLEDDGRPTPLMEERVNRMDGTVANVEAVAIPVMWGVDSAAHLILRDVTERHSTERALRISEKKFRSVIENVSDAVYQSNFQGTLLFVNPAMVRMLGYGSEEELLKVNARDLYVHAYQRNALLEELEIKERVQDFELRLRRKDGNQISCVANTRVVRKRSGEVLYYEGTLRDVTEWLRIREELRRSEERYRQYFDLDLAGHFITKADGTMLACNAAFARILGYSGVEEILAVNASEFYPDKYVREQRLRHLKSVGSLETVESDRRRKDGSIIRIVENVRASFGPSGSIEQVYGFIVDVTSRKQLEEQLREAQKMETLGTLAGGVAHDFNNLLAIIRGYSDMIRREGHVAPGGETYLAAIETAVDRGASTVRQLMTFAREDRGSTAPVDMNGTIKEVLKLARATLPETIQIDQSLQDGLPVVLGDASQLNQAMLNLINNARDAMPSGGILRIVTNLVSGDAARAIDNQAGADEYIHVVVQDEGEGMSDETRARMFEPFFTTKGIGKGSGLGLAVVYGVVHGHDGFIDVISHPRQGTEFHVYLPGARDVVAQPSMPASGEVRHGGAETVLVIEDEPMLLELLQVLLESNGYKVLTAADGVEAISIYQEHMTEISVVLSDMGLPKVGGWEVFQKMKEMNPRVRSILASGYLDQHLRSDLIDAGAKDFIQKPYIPDQILRRIREVISEPDLS